MDKYKWNPDWALRDYFAGQALATASGNAPYTGKQDIARWCYQMADEMIKERAND